MTGVFRQQTSGDPLSKNVLKPNLEANAKSVKKTEDSTLMLSVEHVKLVAAKAIRPNQEEAGSGLLPVNREQAITGLQLLKMPGYQAWETKAKAVSAVLDNILVRLVSQISYTSETTAILAVSKNPSVFGMSFAAPGIVESFALFALVGGIMMASQPKQWIHFLGGLRALFFWLVFSNKFRNNLHRQLDFFKKSSIIRQFLHGGAKCCQ